MADARTPARRVRRARERDAIEGAPQADAPERTTGRRADARGKLRVVPERRVRIEREVVREERRVPGEERLEPAAEPCVDHERLVPPEEPVVDEHELGAELDRALEELARDETPHAIVVTSSAPVTWSPCGANSGNRSISSSASAYATISSREAMKTSLSPFEGPAAAAAEGRFTRLKGQPRLARRPRRRRGPVGETWFPPRWGVIGVPRFELGPLRPERSALPGCATPRGSKRTEGVGGRGGRVMREPVSSLRAEGRSPRRRLHALPPGAGARAAGLRPDRRPPWPAPRPRALRRCATGRDRGSPATPRVRPRRGALDRVHRGHRERHGW